MAAWSSPKLIVISGVVQSSSKPYGPVEYYDQGLMVSYGPTS